MAANGSEVPLPVVGAVASLIGGPADTVEMLVTENTASIEVMNPIINTRRTGPKMMAWRFACAALGMIVVTFLKLSFLVACVDLDGALGL